MTSALSPDLRPPISLEMRSLYGDDFRPKSVVGHWLLACRRTRELRAWITPGSYGWYRLTDELRAQQRKLLEFRPAAPVAP